MPEDSAYSVARDAAKACALASAASAPPLWLFSQLTPYHFLFVAPTTLSLFGSLINVCAFTGYLLAAAAIPTSFLYAYGVGTEFRDRGSAFLSLGIVFMAVTHFYHGVMGWGPPNEISRTIGALLLLSVVIRWITPVHRFFRAHPLFFVPVAFTIGISLAVLALYDFSSPMVFPRRITDGLGHTQTTFISIKGDDYTFYIAKNVLDFRFWDWLAALAGALVYLGVMITWQNLLKPSAPGPKAD